MSAEVQPLMGLEAHGIHNVSRVYWNLTTAPLYEEAIRRREGLAAHLGPLVCRTGQHTGRSPNDKFVVQEPSSADEIWWGKVNRPIEPENFDEAAAAACWPTWRARTSSSRTATPAPTRRYRLPIRVITENAWHSLFARNMFIPERDRAKLEHHQPAVHRHRLPAASTPTPRWTAPAPRSSSSSTSSRGSC